MRVIRLQSLEVNICWGEVRSVSGELRYPTLKLTVMASAPVILSKQPSVPNLPPDRRWYTCWHLLLRRWIGLSVNMIRSLTITKHNRTPVTRVHWNKRRKREWNFPNFPWRQSEHRKPLGGDSFENDEQPLSLHYQYERSETINPNKRFLHPDIRPLVGVAIGLLAIGSLFFLKFPYLVSYDALQGLDTIPYSID